MHSHKTEKETLKNSILKQESPKETEKNLENDNFNSDKNVKKEAQVFLPNKTVIFLQYCFRVPILARVLPV